MVNHSEVKVSLVAIRSGKNRDQGKNKKED